MGKINQVAGGAKMHDFRFAGAKNWIVRKEGRHAQVYQAGKINQVAGSSHTRREKITKLRGGGVLLYIYIYVYILFLFRIIKEVQQSQNRCLPM